MSFKDVEVEAELLLTIEPELYELEIKLEGNVGWVISLKV